MLTIDTARPAKTVVLVGALTVTLFLVLWLTIALVPHSAPTSTVAGEDDGPYTQDAPVQVANNGSTTYGP